MDKENLFDIIKQDGWKIEEIQCGNSTDLEFFKYSPAGEDFSFCIDNSEDAEKITQNIYQYAENFDPSEHMALWVEYAGKNGTPDLLTLADDARDIEKMLESLADKIREKTQKTIREIIEQDVLKLIFDYENTSFCRTHYIGNRNGKKYNIVILRNGTIDEICTASPDGKPSSPLKAGIKILLNNKNYIVEKQNGYSVLKEV